MLILKPIKILHAEIVSLLTLNIVKCERYQLLHVQQPPEVTHPLIVKSARQVQMAQF